MKKKKGFWNREYRKKTGGNFSLSKTPSEDVEKFTRFLIRRSGRSLLNVTTTVLDVGCGNGRNGLFLRSSFGMRVVGYDLSKEAVREAQATATEGGNSEADARFFVHSLAQPIPLKENSITIALDMMASHILKRKEREQLRDELFRVVRPGGWLLFKSFLLEEDKNARELLARHPGPEEGMYLHPTIKVPEFVWKNTEEVIDFFSPLFTVHKTEKSFKHLTKAGKPWKRRSVTLYLEKPE